MAMPLGFAERTIVIIALKMLENALIANSLHYEAKLPPGTTDEVVRELMEIINQGGP